MKKVLNLILTTAMTLSLAACSGNTPSGSDPTPPSGPSSGNGSTSNVPVSDDVGEHRWICGIDSPKDAVAFYYIEKMSQELDRLSNGNMTIEIYTDGTLGGDVALLESLASGNVNFVVQNPAPEVNIMPKLAVFDLPCAFSNIEEFRTAIDSPKLLEQLYPIYEQAGYKLLGFADQTDYVMTSNKKVEKIEDFQGIKIRTMENPNHMAFWTAWGASPTPMAFSEVYTGLQQGTITAQENPYATLAGAKIQEVQDYCIQTNHLPHPIVMIMNLEEYNSLTDGEKAIIAEAFAAAQAYGREMADKQEKEKLELIKEAGTEIVPISEALYDQMVKQAQPVYDSIAEKIGEELVNAYLGR